MFQRRSFIIRFKFGDTHSFFFSSKILRHLSKLEGVHFNSTIIFEKQHIVRYIAEATELDSVLLHPKDSNVLSSPFFEGEQARDM